MGNVTGDTPQRRDQVSTNDHTGDVADSTNAGRLADQLCFALYAATNAITRVYRPMLNELGLTYPQFLVLLVLFEHRSMRLGEIAEQLDLATHAVSPIVDRLEEAGYVARERDTSDGRVVHVVLTATGAALEGSVFNVQDAIRCRTLLADDEVVRLRTELQTLIDRLGD